MEPLICPQCGGAITDYSPLQNFATCGYCSTRFLISAAKAVPADDVTPDFAPSKGSGAPTQAVFIAIGLVVMIFGLSAVIAIMSTMGKATRSGATSTPRPAVTPTPYQPTPPVDPSILTFGGPGTGNGLFTDAGSIAVDKNGLIYVGDKTLRVQQFDASGKFVKLWQIPAKGANYEHARWINKVAVDDNGRMYVAIGGVILIYNGGADKPVQTIQIAPQYIQNFAVRSDGSILFVSNDGDAETLYFADRSGRISKRIRAFHTEPADASMSPMETGLNSIRIAVDGPGNIYSVFALGSLGSYSLSYNAEELLIERFTREGKYVNKFVTSMDSVDIATDNQSRLYVSDGGALNIYTNTGEQVNSITDANSISAFALDHTNHIYLVANEYVRKLPASP
ncbi:MAG: hypothetical protein ABJA02_14190 [Acidobacteriota bacterium]